MTTCPLDGLADSSLHPVPRGNMFESFVVAPQAVQLHSSGGGGYSDVGAELLLAWNTSTNMSLFILGFPISSFSLHGT